MRDNIEEIKSRLDIVEVLSGYIRLKKAGANYQALCPFHNEKTPSFVVSSSKQIWHCFGACDEGGDIFKFIMKLEGLEFPETLRLLAEKAGLELKAYSPQAESERDRLLDFNERAVRYFEKCLRVTPQALQYLRARGLTSETIKEFRLGYAPEDTKALKMFRSRIIFPIMDSASRVIGFSGRILNKESGGGKYINSPDSPLYNKSRVLYGFNFARQEIKKQDTCVIVEGNIDVILSRQAGVKNVVASSGSALSLDQLKTIGRLSKNLIFAFDADPAGLATAKRAASLALPLDFSIKAVALTKKDPADLINKNPALWQKAIEKAIPWLEFILKTTLAQFDKTQLLGKKRIVAEFLPWLARVFNPIEKAHWLARLSQKINIKEEALLEEMGRLYSGAKEKILESKEKKPSKSREERLKERVASLVFAFFPKTKLKFLGGYESRRQELTLALEQEEIKDPKKELASCRQRLRILNLRKKLITLARKIEKTEKLNQLKALSLLIKKFKDASQKITQLEARE